MNTDTPTPRTDAEIVNGEEITFRGKYVSADFARTLERENEALRAEKSNAIAVFLKHVGTLGKAAGVLSQNPDFKFISDELQTATKDLLDALTNQNTGTKL